MIGRKQERGNGERGERWRVREFAEFWEIMVSRGSGRGSELRDSTLPVLGAVGHAVGDVDADHDVGLADRGNLLVAYAVCEGDPDCDSNGDFDGDGCVDLWDLLTLLDNYGRAPGGWRPGRACGTERPQSSVWAVGHASTQYTICLETLE